MFDNEESLIETGCGFSKRNDAREAGLDAVHQALRSIRRHPVSVLMVFASVRFDPDALLEGIRSAAGRVPLVGTSTAGEICNGVLKQSVVVAALASPYLRVHSAVGRHVANDWEAAVDEAAGSSDLRPFFFRDDPADDTFHKALRREGKSIFGMLFSPGNTRTADSRSREILLALRQRCRRIIPFCGGSSADDWRLEKNYVFRNASVYDDAVIVTIFETQLQNGMGLAHGFQPSEKKLIVTRADDHIVHEINHRPADEAYGELIGMSVSEMEGIHLTLETGKPVGFSDPYDEFAINVAGFTTENGGVRFMQPVAEGVQLVLMDANPDTMVEAGKQAFQKALFRGGINHPAFALVFSCALRNRILKERSEEEVDGIRDIAGEACIAGFLSFGEQGLADSGGNCHGNELISVLAIGRNLTPAAEVWFENQRLLKEKEWAEKSLLEANAFRESVIEHVAEGLCVFHEIDRPPFIRFDIWNGRMVEITGYNIDDINRVRRRRSGRNVSDGDAGILDKAKAVIERLQAGGCLRGEECEVTAKNGEKRIVAISANALTFGGNQQHVLAIIYDLTRQKETEKERLALERRSQHVQKIESLGAMAGGIAHDFNNILMVILGNIELALAEAQEPSSLRNYLHEMEKSVFKAADLTRKILAYTGKAQFVITAVDLNTIVESTSRSLAATLPAVIQLEMRLGRNLPAVKADAAQIHQIIVNLVTNAAEAYASDKGGRITVSTGSLYCDADCLAQNVKDVTGYENLPPEGLYVFVEVSDTAGGMDESAARRVFDPFFTTKFQGRGLGMSMVLGIVRGLGGAILLETTVEKGTTIRILFPAVSEDAPASGSRFNPDRNAAPAGEGRTILLVDDEAKILKLAGAMLERLGYRVLSAGGGEEAVRLYREHQKYIHGVLLDLSMPEMSGRDVFRQLRRLNPNICVILSSGYTEEAVMMQFKGDRPAGFIQKPYRLQRLGKKMKDIFENIT